MGVGIYIISTTGLDSKRLKDVILESSTNLSRDATMLSLHVYCVVFFYVVFLCIVYGDNSIIGFLNQ